MQWAYPPYDVLLQRVCLYRYSVDGHMDTDPRYFAILYLLSLMAVSCQQPVRARVAEACTGRGIGCGRSLTPGSFVFLGVEGVFEVQDAMKRTHTTQRGTASDERVTVLSKVCSKACSVREEAAVSESGPDLHHVFSVFDRVGVDKLVPDTDTGVDAHDGVSNTLPMYVIMLYNSKVQGLCKTIGSVDTRQLAKLTRPLANLTDLTARVLKEVLRNQKTCATLCNSLGLNVLHFIVDCAENSAMFARIVCNQVPPDQWTKLVCGQTTGELKNAGMEPGITPLMLAALHGNIEFAKFMLEPNQCNDHLVTMTDHVGYTALHWCAPVKGALRGSVEVAKLLLQKGADPNAQDVHGGTLLWYAVDAISPLSEQGIAMAETKPEKEEAILPLVCLLLEHGANPGVTPPGRLSPFQLAQSHEFESLVVEMQQDRQIVFTMTPAEVHHLVSILDQGLKVKGFQLGEEDYRQSWFYTQSADILRIHRVCGLGKDDDLTESDVDFRDWGSFGVLSQVEQARLKRELVEVLRSPSGMHADLGAKVRQIEQTDPRVGLRGQSGLFLQSPPISSRFIIGVFAGEYAAMEDNLNSASVARVVETYSYTMDIEKRSLATATFWKNFEILSHKSGVLNVNPMARDDSGKLCGNMTMFANDAKGNRDRPHRGPVPRENADLVVAYVKGFPVPCIVGRAGYAPGAETLIDYGRQYWENRDTEEGFFKNVIHHQTCKMAQNLSQKLLKQAQTFGAARKRRRTGGP